MEEEYKAIVQIKDRCVELYRWEDQKYGARIINIKYHIIKFI